MSWELVEERLKTAKAIAYDGCHKIYLAMDERQYQQFKTDRWGESGNEIFLDVEDPTAALNTIHEWFDKSCGLEFVNAISGEGRNEDFEQLIQQFEFAEWNDEEDE